MAHRYVIGPWVLKKSDITAWYPPEGTVGAIDIRAAADYNAPGVGFFALQSGAPFDATSYRDFGIGDLRDIAPKDADRAVFASMLGVAEVSGDKLADWLFTALTEFADPLRDTAAKPIMPGLNRVLELHLGGHGLVIARPFAIGSIEAQPCVALLQEEYCEHRRDVLAGRNPSQHHRKVLGYWGRKFRVNNPEDIFIPSGMKKETALTPETSFLDSFGRGDSSDLNASSTGKTPDFSWTEVSGAWDISSNTLRITTGATLVRTLRCEGVLSSSDNYGQIKLPSTPANVQGAMCRFAAAAETGYAYFWRDANGRWEVFKDEAGTTTFLQAGAGTAAAGDTVKCQVSGSTITAYRNGTQDATVGNFTDTALSTGVRGGVIGLDVDNYSYDDFETADLGGGGGGGSVVGSNFLRHVAQIGA